MKVVRWKISDRFSIVATFSRHRGGLLALHGCLLLYIGHYSSLSGCPGPGLNVTITTQYSPPAGVTLTPPNYRAATSVSLWCDAVGTTGSVSYQWSSTCGSGCFVNGSSQSVSRDKLWSYDAGQHTCIVTDEVGNTGRATTEMNIIGNYGICLYSQLYISQHHRNSYLQKWIKLLPGKSLQGGVIYHWWRCACMGLRCICMVWVSVLVRC